jgi:hypothetical protein
MSWLKLRILERLEQADYYDLHLSNRINRNRKVFVVIIHCLQANQYRRINKKTITNFFFRRSMRYGMTISELGYNGKLKLRYRVYERKYDGLRPAEYRIQDGIGG